MNHPQLNHSTNIIEIIKVAWKNWRARDVAKSYKTLTQAMRDDPEYYKSWQCNITMPIYDGSKGKLTIEESNEIATKLMNHLFEQYKL